MKALFSLSLIIGGINHSNNLPLLELVDLTLYYTVCHCRFSQMLSISCVFPWMVNVALSGSRGQDRMSPLILWSLISEETSLSCSLYLCLQVSHGSLSPWPHSAGVLWTWTWCTHSIDVQNGKRNSMHGGQLHGRWVWTWFELTLLLWLPLYTRKICVRCSVGHVIILLT